MILISVGLVVVDSNSTSRPFVFAFALAFELGLVRTPTATAAQTIERRPPNGHEQARVSLLRMGWGR